MKKIASNGPIIPNLSGRVVNGELWLKGPNIFPRYHNNPTADAETFTEEGWMKTGDVVHVDEDGHIYVIDRVKEVGNLTQSAQ